MDPGASAYGDHRLTTLASNRFAPTCFLTCGDLMKQQYASSNECTQCPTTMSLPLNHGGSTPAASMTLLCSWPRDASLLTCMVTPGKMSLPPKPRRVTVTSPSSSLSPSLPCCATSLASSLSARGRLHRLHPSIDRLKGGLVLESNWQRMMSMMMMMMMLTMMRDDDDDGDVSRFSHDIA